MGGKGSGRRKKDIPVSIDGKQVMVDQNFIDVLECCKKERKEPEAPQFDLCLAGCILLACFAVMAAVMIPQWFDSQKAVAYEQGRVAGVAQMQGNVTSAFDNGIEFGKLGYSLSYPGLYLKYAHRDREYSNATHSRSVNQNFETESEYEKFGWITYNFSRW